MRLTLSASVRIVYVHSHVGCGCMRSGGQLGCRRGGNQVATPAEHLQPVKPLSERPVLRAIDPAAEPDEAITIEGAVEMFFGDLRLAPRSKKTYRNGVTKFLKH